MKTRAHVCISGYVQGVFFRYHTRELAQQLSLRGWVQNTPDDRVEAVFEGEKGAVESMLEFCHRGPSGARVTDVEIKWEQPRGEFSGFEVRYGW